jgi:hypothetical protein
MSATGYNIANGTDVITYVQTTLTTGGNTFSSPSNVFYGNGANLIGCTGVANMVTTNAAQTIVPIKTFTQGIYMPTTCIQGRNDGFLYTTIPPGFGTTQPIGHNISLTTGATALTANNSEITNVTMPTMSAGVWIVSSNVQITKGTSTWTENNYVRLGYTFAGSPGAGDISGCRNILTWAGGATGPLMSCQYQRLHFIAYNGSQVQPRILMFYGTAGNGTYILNFNAVKVA